MTSIPASKGMRLPIARVLKNRNRPNVQQHHFTTTSSIRNESQPDPRPSRQPGGSHSKHRLFYREFYPPLFRCLAYGTGAYFSLHLLWQYLDSSEQKILREQEKSALLDSVKELRSGLQSGVQSVKEGVKEGVESVKESVDSGDQKKRTWWSRS